MEKTLLNQEERGIVAAFKGNGSLRLCVQDARDVHAALKSFRLKVFKERERRARGGNSTPLVYQEDLLEIAAKELFLEKEDSFGVLIFDF